MADITGFDPFDIPAQFVSQNLDLINVRLESALANLQGIIDHLTDINFDAATAPAPQLPLVTVDIPPVVAPTAPTGAQQFGNVTPWDDPGYIDLSASAGINENLVLAPVPFVSTVGPFQFPSPLGALDTSGEPPAPTINTNFPSPTAPGSFDASGQPTHPELVEVPTVTVPTTLDISGEPTPQDVIPLSLPAPPSNVTPGAAPTRPTMLNLDSVSAPPDTIDLGALPTKQALFPLNIPDRPPAPVAGQDPNRPDFLPLPSVGDAPGDIAIGDEPQPADAIPFDLPEPPSAISTSGQPTKPPTSDVLIPPVPTFTMPPDPVYIELNLPTQPQYNIAPFLGVRPVFDGITPTDTFSWVEPTYDGPLLDPTRAKIVDMMNGSTALSSAIQYAFFSAGREQEQITALANIEATSDEWAARGFRMPPGMLAASIRRAREGAMLAENTLSRDTTTKLATWAREDIRAAVENALTMEAMTGAWFQAAVGRSFEAAKYHLEIEVKLYESAIALFNASESAYQVDATVQAQMIQAELGKLQIFKAQLEGELAKGQINDQRLKQYLGAIEGVKAIIATFEAQMSGVRAVADTNRSILEGYATDVSAWHELMDVRQIPFNVYKLQIEGVTAVAGINQSNASVFESRVRAFAAILVARQFPLEVYKTKLEGVNATVEVNRGLASLYESDVRVFVEKLLLQKLSLDAYGVEMQGVQATAELNKIITDIYGRDIEALAQTLAVKKYPLEVYEQRLRGQSIQSETNRNLGALFDSDIRGFLASIEALKIPVDIWSKLVDGQRAIADINNVNASIFATQARAHETTMEARKIPFEVAKLQQEGAQIVAAYNRNLVEMFGIDASAWEKLLDARRVPFQVYSDQIKDRGTSVEVEGLIVKNFTAQTANWAQTLAARKTAWEAQKLNFDMELIRGQAKESEVRAFVESLRGSEIEKENKAAFVNLKIAGIRASTENYSARLQAERDRVQSELDQVRAKTQSFIADIQRYAAEITGQNESRRQSVEFALAQLSNNIRYYEVIIREYDQALARQQHRNDQLLEAVKATGQYATGVVAGLAGSIHVSSQVDGRGDISRSFQQTQVLPSPG